MVRTIKQSGLSDHQLKPDEMWPEIQHSWIQSILFADRIIGGGIVVCQKDIRVSADLGVLKAPVLNGYPHQNSARICQTNWKCTAIRPLNSGQMQISVWCGQFFFSLNFLSIQAFRHPLGVGPSGMDTKSRVASIIIGKHWILVWMQLMSLKLDLDESDGSAGFCPAGKDTKTHWDVI